MDKVYAQAAQELLHIAYDLDTIENSLGKPKDTADEMASQIKQYDDEEKSNDPNMSQHALAQDYEAVLDFWNSAEGQDPKIKGADEAEDKPMSLEQAAKEAKGLNRKWEYPSSKKAFLRKSSHANISAAIKKAKK